MADPERPPDEEELVGRLTIAGRKLQFWFLQRSILHTLEEIEDCLHMMNQSPSHTLLTAMTPIVASLKKQVWLSHIHGEVRIMVASCLCEILRIFAPHSPFDDSTLRKILEMLVGSFENLKDITSPHFHRSMKILETFAKVGVGNIMLDLEMDELMYDMFHKFIASAREEHTNSVIAAMRSIIVLIIEEGEYIFQPLLSMLLSVWKQDLVVSNMAHQLVGNIIEECEKKLKPFLDNEEIRKEEQPTAEITAKEDSQEEFVKEEKVPVEDLPTMEDKEESEISHEVCIIESQNVFLGIHTPTFVDDIVENDDIEDVVDDKCIEEFSVCDRGIGYGLDLSIEPLERSDHNSFRPFRVESDVWEYSIHDLTLSVQLLSPWDPGVLAPRDGVDVEFTKSEISGQVWLDGDPHMVKGIACFLDVCPFEIQPLMSLHGRILGDWFSVMLSWFEKTLPHMGGRFSLLVFASNSALGQQQKLRHIYFPTHQLIEFTCVLMRNDLIDLMYAYELVKWHELEVFIGEEYASLQDMKGFIGKTMNVIHDEFVDSRYFPVIEKFSQFLIHLDLSTQPWGALMRGLECGAFSFPHLDMDAQPCGALVEGRGCLALTLSVLEWNIQPLGDLEQLLKTILQQYWPLLLDSSLHLVMVAFVDGVWEYWGQPLTCTLADLYCSSYFQRYPALFICMLVPFTADFCCVNFRWKEGQSLTAVRRVLQLYSMAVKEKSVLIFPWNYFALVPSCEDKSVHCFSFGYWLYFLQPWLYYRYEDSKTKESGLKTFRSFVWATWVRKIQLELEGVVLTWYDGLHRRESIADFLVQPMRSEFEQYVEERSIKMCNIESSFAFTPLDALATSVTFILMITLVKIWDPGILDGFRNGESQQKDLEDGLLEDKQSSGRADL